MINTENREFMSKLYRLIEKYETPLITRYTDEMEDYMKRVAADANNLFDEYKGNEFATELTMGFFTAVGERFQRYNKFPLIERSK